MVMGDTPVRRDKGGEPAAFNAAIIHSLWPHLCGANFLSITNISDDVHWQSRMVGRHRAWPCPAGHGRIAKHDG